MKTRRVSKTNRRQGRAKLVISVALALIVVALAGCTALSPSRTRDSDVAEVSTDTPSTPPQTEQRQAVEDEPLRIIIYTDYQCGACERLHARVEPELRRRYVDTGKATMETRPVGALNPDSERAAEAALCAADQERFAEYEDALFQAWASEDFSAFSSAALVDRASWLGLDDVPFADCLQRGVKRLEVQNNLKAAQAQGVRTLPAVSIGNVMIQGNKPLEVYVQAIERVLSGG